MYSLGLDLRLVNVFLFLFFFFFFCFGESVVSLFQESERCRLLFHIW